MRVLGNADQQRKGQAMKRVISFLTRVFSFTNRTYRLSLADSSVLVNEFFDGNPPPEVAVPADLRGDPDQRYVERKLNFQYNNRNVKIFYMINKRGLLGNLYTTGINLNTSGVAPAVAMSRSTAINKIVNCGSDFNCVLKVLGQAQQDCMNTKSATDCWMCRQVTGDPGDDDCVWLN
jgi:hypothetical protein